MKRLLLALAILIAATLGARAQTPVSVIGPIVPGDCVKFNSTTVLADNGTICNAAAMPGGVNGSIQYNNGGNFGGFVMNGDCLTNTATGAIICTKTNGAAFVTPGGSSGNVQTNNGSGGLAGITNTQLTALVNPFSSVLSGAVPASGGGTLNFIRADGTWIAPPGAVVRVWPNASQTNSASSPYIAQDPWGNAINCTSTTTQCVNEALNAAAAAGWSVEVSCVGKTQANATPTPLITTSTIVIPPGFGLHVTFRQCYISNTTSNPVVLVDSQDGSNIFLHIFPNPGAGFNAVNIMPTNTNAALGNGKHILNSTIYVESAAPGTGAVGCNIDSTNGSITGNDITCQDPNGGAVGIRVNVNSGTPFIIEENKIRARYIHGSTTAGVQGLTSVASSGFCRKNQWYIGRISPASATDGFSTFCQNDTIIGLSVSNEEGTVTNGIHIQQSAGGNTFIGANILGATTGVRVEVSAVANVFLGGTDSATTAKVDGGIGTQFINMAGVSNMTVGANLDTCNAAKEGNTSAVTDATSNTWGTGISGGGANIVFLWCNGINWTVMGK